MITWDDVACRICGQTKLVNDGINSYCCFHCGQTYDNLQLENLHEQQRSRRVAVFFKRKQRAAVEDIEDKSPSKKTKHQQKNSLPISLVAETFFDIDDVTGSKSGGGNSVFVDGLDVCESGGGNSLVNNTRLSTDSHGRCSKYARTIINDDYDVICLECGLVVASGMSLFEYGCLPGSPFHNRRGSYKIIYYWNEKLAQWSRRCPPPSPENYELFISEARRTTTYGPPARFTRRTIAKICRAIGLSTMQEKWLLLFDKLAVTEGFSDVPRFPTPNDKLLGLMQTLFKIVLPVWFQCKDIDVSDDVQNYIKAHPELANDRQITTWIIQPSNKLQKKRKSFPHNFMTRKYLEHIQMWFPHDPELSNCFECHQSCHKQISRPREFYQNLIWIHISETINTAGLLDFSLFSSWC